MVIYSIKLTLPSAPCDPSIPPQAKALVEEQVAATWYLFSDKLPKSIKVPKEAISL